MTTSAIEEPEIGSNAPAAEAADAQAADPHAELADAFAVLEQDLRRLMREAGEARYAVDQSRRETREHTRALLLGVLESTDALDRVFESAGAKPAEVTPQMRIWLNNFRTARLLLGRVIEDQELVRFAPETGEVFDPHQHRVSSTLADSARPDGCILGVVTAGYLWNGALLRKAAVVVVRNAGSEAAPDAESPGSGETGGEPT
jgi:molecular chaperone GrpE